MKRHLSPLIRLMAVSATAALIAAACSGDGPSEVSQAPEPTRAPQGPTTSRQSPTVESRQVADFKITAYRGADVLGGQEVAFSDLFSHGRPVVLNIWAGLCPPCRAELPDLQAMYNDNHDRLLLVGLDVGPFVGLGSNEDGRRLLEELRITYPTGTTPDSRVIRDYRVFGMPTTYFIKPDGTIHRQWSGQLDKKKLNELVTDLLSAS